MLPPAQKTPNEEPTVVLQITTPKANGEKSPENPPQDDRPVTFVPFELLINSKPKIEVYDSQLKKVELYQGCTFHIDGDKISVNEVKRDEFTDFILTSVAIANVERSQLIETFGATYVMFFGKAPQVLVCNGILANSPNNPWLHEFTKNYEEVFRGTELVKAKRIIHLYVLDTVYRGYMLDYSHNMVAETSSFVQFQFRFFVVDKIKIAMEPYKPEKPVIAAMQDAAEKEAKVKDKKLWQRMLQSAASAAWQMIRSPATIRNFIRNPVGTSLQLARAVGYGAVSPINIFGMNLGYIGKSMEAMITTAVKGDRQPLYMGLYGYATHIANYMSVTPETIADALFKGQGFSKFIYGPGTYQTIGEHSDIFTVI